MRKKIICLTVFFAIFLIVTLPFYIADAYAQDFSRIERIIYPTPAGVGNSSGYILPSDTLTLLVNLRAKDVPEAEVASHVFFVAGALKEPFAACENLNSSWYNCVFQKAYYDLSLGVYKGNVVLEAPECSTCTYPFEVTVDGKTPAISNIRISPLITNAANVTVSYRAVDTACNDPECSGRCSGIDKVVFFRENSFATAKTLDLLKDRVVCDFLAEKTADISGIPSGAQSVCLLAYDKAGNSNLSKAQCQNITIDREAPVASIPLITDNEGNPFAFIKPEGLYTILRINITSDYANLTKAEADLSSFNLNNRTLDCNKILKTRIWECKTQFFAQLPADSVQQKITIYTYDNAGNEGKKDFLLGLKVDRTAPEITAVKTNYMFNNTPFFGKESNELSVEIAETDSGFYKNQTFVSGLDSYFSVSSGGAGTLYKSWCLRSGTGWRCWWPPLNLKTSQDMAQLSFKVIDDSNNEFDFVKRIKIDQQEPKLVAVEMHTANAYPAVGAGQRVVIRANITDDTSILDNSGNYNVYMDLTRIEGGKDARNADACELTNITTNNEGFISKTYWSCIWLISNTRAMDGWIPRVNISDVTKRTISKISDNNYIVSVSPVTGNLSYTKVAAYEIYKVAENVSDLWNIAAGEPIPAAVDRQIAPIVETNVYSKLSYYPLQGGAEVIAISLLGCLNDGTARSFSLFPDNPEDPWIETVVQRGDYSAISSLSYLCQVETTSVYDGTLNVQEVDNVTISIGLDNMPLGRIDTSIESKLDEAKEWADNRFFQFLGQLNLLFQWTQTICNLLKTLTAIWAIVSSIGHGGWKEACAIVQICRPVKEAHDAAQLTFGIFSTTLESVARPACNLATCGYSQRWLAQINQVLTPSVLQLFAGSGQGGASQTGTPGGQAEQDAGRGHSISDIVPAATSSAFLAGGGFFPSDPSESLILSMATLCVPGIIYNFEKFRQIKCQRGACIITMSQEGGPLYACDQIYRNQMCAAVVGEVFSIIPFGSVLQGWANIVEGLLSNPLSFVMTIAWLGCLPIKEESSLWAACDTANAVKNGIQFVMGLISQYQTLERAFSEGIAGPDACEIFNDMYDQLEEQRSQQTAV